MKGKQLKRFLDFESELDCMIFARNILGEK